MENNHGFTLLELMIVVALIAILTLFAIPSYLSHIERTRRTDGAQSLLEAYARMERYYTENNTYATATINTNGSTDILTDPEGGTAGQAPSRDGYYTIRITAQNASSFTLSAIPDAEQAGDTLCGTLTINQLSRRSQTGTGSVDDCWK